MRSEGSVFEGKTLDDAVRKGLDALGLSRAEVMITVVEEGSGGFLGFGARPYRVRVAPRPGGPIGEAGERQGRDRRGRRGSARSGRSARGGRGAERTATPRGPGGHREVATVSARDDEGRERKRRKRRRRGRDASGERESGGRREAGSRPAEGRPARGEARTLEPPAELQAQPEGSNEAAPRRNAARAEAPPRTGDAPMLGPEALAAEGKRLTEELLRYMQFEATVTASAEEDQVSVAVVLQSHEDLLTGRKGEVRQALQHLLNLMLNRGSQAHYHLHLEINDFWQRREQELRDLASSLAEQAVSNGAEAVTEYLNAQERRVIHMALKDDERVKTYALGTGLIKRIAVAPADYPEGSKTDR